MGRDRCTVPYCTSGVCGKAAVEETGASKHCDRKRESACLFWLEGAPMNRAECVQYLRVELLRCAALHRKINRLFVQSQSKRLVRIHVTVGIQ